MVSVSNGLADNPSGGRPAAFPLNITTQDPVLRKVSYLGPGFPVTFRAEAFNWLNHPNLGATNGYGANNDGGLDAIRAAAHSAR